MRERRMFGASKWIGMAVAALAVALLGGLGGDPRPAGRIAETGPTAKVVETLPLAAQGLISRTLGRDDSSYHARAESGGLAFENRRHGLAARFDARGAEVRSGSSRLGLSLRAVGYGETLDKVLAAIPQGSTNRVEYRRGALTEWYSNGPLGLEQGFTLVAPPTRQGPGPLTLALELSGPLTASLAPGGDALSFATEAGAPSLRYRGLTAFDVTGRELPARLELRDATLLLRVDDDGARYPLTVDPFVEQGRLTASDGAAGDAFGAVAASGDIIVVGAAGDDIGANLEQGSAYIFVRSAGGWAGDLVETARLTASDGASDDFFGRSVAVSGDTVVVGAYSDDVGANASQGSAYVFVRPAGGWAGTLIQTAKLTPSDGGSQDTFGNSVAVFGDTVVVGAPFADPGASVNRGSAYLFVRPAGGWVDATETATLTSSDGAAGDFFGWSVAVSGDTVVVGARRNDVGSNLEQGSAYVFVEPALGWANATQQAKLTASDGAANDEFGYSVAVSADTVVVGALYDDISTRVNQGSAYVFVEPFGGWVNATQTAKLTASAGPSNDRFGSSVAVSGPTVVVGAAGDQGAGSFGNGSAYLFTKPVAGWRNATEHAKLTASDGAPSDEFGHSVAVSGPTIVVGARHDDVGANVNQGTAYIFVADADDDGVPDDVDNCATMANPNQRDTDFDGTGDLCDGDDDADGVNDASDNCPLVGNPDQADNDSDSLGDACDLDDDNDDIADGGDNCPLTSNAGQTDTDADALGDACDPDDDNDGVLDGNDSCRVIPNAGQANNDGDAMGDACDPDDDNDTVLDAVDNCRFVANATQYDTDHDGIGDECDSTPGNTPCLVEGMGWLSTNRHAQFSFRAWYVAGATAPQGEVLYQDLAAGLSLSLTRITSVISYGMHAVIRGLGRANGVLVSFRIDVDDRTLFGRRDVFQIRLSNGYRALGYALNGDVRIDCSEGGAQ